MIDAHCHLEYMRDADSVIEDAKRRGMAAVVTAIADIKHDKAMLALRSRHPDFVFVCMGLHPAEVEYGAADVDAQIEAIRKSKNDIAAVGEVGLDYHHVKDEARREETRQIFARFIEIANALKKPLVIHCRDAMSDALSMLEAANVPVMMHFFTGTRDEMNEAVGRGYYISFTTITVRNKQLRKLAKLCPLENMLLETDAPWLDPNPDTARGGDPFELTNRPWNIALTAEKIAKEKKTSKEEVLSATTENARRLFGID